MGFNIDTCGQCSDINHRSHKLYPLRAKLIARYVTAEVGFIHVKAPIHDTPPIECPRSTFAHALAMQKAPCVHMFVGVTDEKPPDKCTR